MDAPVRQGQRLDRTACGGSEARGPARLELLDEVDGEGEFALDEDGCRRAGRDTLEHALADGGNLSGTGFRRDIGERFIDDFPAERFGLSALRSGPVVRRVIGEIEEHS